MLGGLEPQRHTCQKRCEEQKLTKGQGSRSLLNYLGVVTLPVLPDSCLLLDARAYLRGPSEPLPPAKRGLRGHKPHHQNCP